MGTHGIGLTGIKIEVVIAFCYNIAIRIKYIQSTTMDTTQKWQQYQCLHPQLIKTLQHQGFDNPTLIQSEVFENYKHYYDFLIAAQTGSGKTLAFAAPIISDLLALTQKTQLPDKVLCLVMTPTRQLAQQIDGVINLLIKDTPIRQTCILGGMSMARQLRVLKQQAPHIIIGTPGRLHELLNQNELNFQTLKYLVIDQADRMIEMGHYIQLDQILNKIFQPKIQQFYEKDFDQINQKLANADTGEFYILANGKQKKINFNLNSFQTEKLFQVPMDLFHIEGQLPIISVPQNHSNHHHQKRRRGQYKQQNQENQQIIGAPETQLMSEIITKMKRRIFFISATLTREFKGTKYFTKKNKNIQQDDKKKSKSKDKKHKKQQENQYTPKLKALLSRVKFDAKPKIIDQSSQIFLPAKLKEKYCFCSSDVDKITTILCYINELPQNSKIIIFTNTIRASKRVKYFIQSAGLRAVTLHSHMIQKQRLQKLERFQKSKSNILISTDVAARGLDFVITNVIQFSVPINGDTYVHRVGRTARANRPGQALVLISEKQATRWEEISETLQGSDSNRKAEKYCPLQGAYQSTKQKVEQYEWIRLNDQKQQNKRIQKLNQMEAQQFGVEAEDEIKKPKRVSEQQERLHNQKIQKQIKQIKNKNKAETKKSNMPEVGDGKIWKKNKLVMSLDQIKKYL